MSTSRICSRWAPWWVTCAFIAASDLRRRRLMAPMTEAFVRNIDQFVNHERCRCGCLQKWQRKDDVTQKYLRQFRQHEGVLYVGKAQEKARVMRTERRRSLHTGGTYPWIVRIHRDGQPLLFLLRR